MSQEQAARSAVSSRQEEVSCMGHQGVNAAKMVTSSDSPIKVEVDCPSPFIKVEVRSLDGFLGYLSWLKETNCKAPWQSQEPLTYPGIVWACLFGVDVVDPDGWRNQSLSYKDSPITYDQFYQFVQESTIYLSERSRNLPIPNSDYKARLAGYAIKLAMCDAISKDFTTRLQDAQDLISKLRKKVDDLERMPPTAVFPSLPADLKDKVVELATKNKRIWQLYELVRHENIKMSVQISTLQESMREMTALLQNAQDEVEKLRGEVASFHLTQTNLELCREQKEELAKRIESLVLELQTKEKDNSLEFQELERYRIENGKLADEVANLKVEYSIERRNVDSLIKTLGEERELLEHTRKQEQLWMDRYLSVVDQLRLQTPKASETAPKPPKDVETKIDPPLRKHGDRTVLEDMATYFFDQCYNRAREEAATPKDNHENISAVAAEMAVTSALAVITECSRYSK